MDNKDFTNLNGKVYVLIGAGSAMGPFIKLLELGATVVALDIPGIWGKGTKRPASGLWKRLIETAKKSPGGKIIFPMDKPQSECATDADLYVSRAVQFHPHVGGQSDFVWLSARTPHVGPQYVW